MMRDMSHAQAIAVAASKARNDGDGRPFRWTSKRDRELRQLREDLFSFADCAKILGCRVEEAKARMKGLREVVAPEMPEREVRYGSQAPLHPVIGPDLASKEPPVTEGAQPSTAAPRPAKIALPRYGEMEKRYDPVARGDFR
ncbi:hypothetical protein [Sphingobium sp. LSP13-1-1.1]|uniref:hypothetical protein n=1 Tax=Sphingobium sp. LSP13-1-1.1 TaxID=3135234 RepID=UPI003414B0F3